MLAQVASTSYAPLGELGPGIAGSTLLVLLLLTAALLALRVLAGRRRGRVRATGSLQVVAQLELTAGQSLYLIRAGGRCLLVGGTAGGLTLLTELDPEQVPPGERAPERGDGDAGVLLQRLRVRFAGASETPLAAVAAGGGEHARAGFSRDLRPGS